MIRTDDSVDRLVDEYISRRLDRRQFLLRAGALGVSASSASALLAACGGDGELGGDVSTKVLRVHLDEDIENLDPAVNPGHADSTVARNIFENLVAFRPGTFETENQLAETWEGSDDGLRWDFTLRKGVQFHGGYGELTAEDVKFSFERVAGLTKPKLDSSYAGDWATLKEVEVRDKYSGTVVLKEPFAPLMLTTIPSIAGEIVSKRAVEELGEDFGTKPIGTGPYEFVEWKPKQRVLLKRFGKWTGAERTAAPIWKQIEFPVIGESNPTVIALETGELEFATLPTNAVDRVKDLGQFDVVSKTTLDYTWIGMNVRHENLKDKNVRLAVRHGVDIPSILEAAFNGKWTRATALLPSGMPIGHWRDAPAYQRDVAKAKDFLAQAGVSAPKLTMTVAKDEEGSATVAEIVQANLADVGIEVEVVVQDSGTFGLTTPEANAKKQLFYTGFSTSPDPSWSTVWFTCNQVGVWNWMSWCNEEYSSLDKQAARTLDQGRRDEMYLEMQRLMDEDVVALWVAWPTEFYAVKKGIKPGLRPDGEIVPWSFRRA